ncbi:hypothetical protein EVAR_16002_1 [Eumeta japonica]|uniref:Uncharacterized protein n=1 Tax=Eumeta variegata TaxID=151549 RepID=A0A4C1ZP99_EUMVA|nr:hypothetical protein EVAR_16002_1 [Eumeta japonica]
MKRLKDISEPIEDMQSSYHLKSVVSVYPSGTCWNRRRWGDGRRNEPALLPPRPLGNESDRWGREVMEESEPPELSLSRRKATAQAATSRLQSLSMSHWSRRPIFVLQSSWPQ